MVTFDIAFSYAVEQNEVINEFKTRLEELGLKVFIDTEHPELFVFKYVPDVLKEIYDNEKIAMLIFISKEYINKNFTKYEGHIAMDRLLMEKRTSIVKIDDSTLPWLPSTFHYFDLHKYSINYICQALFTAIKGTYLVNIEKVFNTFKDDVMSKCSMLKISLDTKSCLIFNVLNSEKSYLKINCSPEEQLISFFYSSSLVEEITYPIAEIQKNETNFVYFNKGISETHDLKSEFISVKELIDQVLSDLMVFLRDLYD